MNKLIKKIISLFKGENDIDEDIIAYFKSKGVDEKEIKYTTLYDLYKDVEEGDYSYEFICR